MELITELKRNITNLGIEQNGRFYSIYRGIVLDNEDSENRGRLMVDIPAIRGYKDLRKWALSAGVPSGENSLYVIPSVGDLIWVFFEGGDVNYPVWVLGNYRDGFTPVEVIEANKPSGLSMKSKSGHKITLNDKDNVLTVKHKDGSFVKLSKDSIEVKAKKIKLTGGGTVEKSVKGETLERVLNKLILTLKTATTVDGKPLNPATIQGLTAVGESLKTIISDTVENE